MACSAALWPLRWVGMTLVWQGRQDSNLRMPGSKPGALGLLATPLRVKPGLGIRDLGFAEAKAHAAAVVPESRIPNHESRSSSAPRIGPATCGDRGVTDGFVRGGGILLK